jgi:hypothetical protein
MNQNNSKIKQLVQKEILQIRDPLVKSSLEKILVEPTEHLREWDYSNKGEMFECWTVAIDSTTDTSLIYSECGHGPKNSWGLVFTSKLNFGMDSSWFDNLEECFLESHLAGDLPIWRLEKEGESGKRELIATDLNTDSVFKIRDDLAKQNKETRFYISARKM